MTDDFSVRSLQIGLRPPRIAILIPSNDSDWIHTSLRIIEWTTQKWGGWYSCLIPTDGQTISAPFWELLERFDPDYFFAYQKTFQDLKTAQPEVYARSVDDAMRTWKEQGVDTDSNHGRQNCVNVLHESEIETFEISSDLQTELITKLCPFTYGENAVISYITAQFAPEFRLTEIADLVEHLQTPIGVMDFQIEGSFLSRLLAYSLTGRLTNEYRDELKRRNIEVGNNLIEADHIGSFMRSIWLYPSNLPAHSPRALSMLNCSMYGYFTSRTTNNPIIVVGDTLNDYCLFHCLSRMRQNVYWLPHAMLTSLHDRLGSASFPEHSYNDNEDNIAHWLATTIDTNTSKNVKVFTSMSLSGEVLANVPSRLDQLKGMGSSTKIEDHSSIENEISILLPSVLEVFEQNNAGYHYLEQFHKNDSVNLVQTPKPKSFNRVHPAKQTWITDLSIQDYVLPKLVEFGPITVATRNYDSDQVRVTRRGFAYFCPNIYYAGGDVDSVLVRPRLYIQSNDEIFAQILQKAGYVIDRSDKGNYHRECVTKFGDLGTLAGFLKVETHRTVLDKFLDKSQSKTDHGDFVDGRRFLDFRTIRSIVNDENAACELIDGLTEKEVIHKGFLFQCEACRNLAWYAVEDVGRTFTCSRCRRTQVYRKQHWRQPEEPKWSYKLDEVFYQGYSNNMSVPILALSALQAKAKDSFLYIPETELKRLGGSKKVDMEVDFFAILDGKIVIGEAKSQSKLNPIAQKELDELGRYKALSDAMLDANVALATFEPEWNERTVREAESIIGSKRLIMLNRQDLLS